ncbi:Sec1-like snare protein [Crepidotus variabilis]|uniref:Sec1-like snare protein n=1 Tax=Crepidotus variabilis TaxID=179855 RepID=A0A9P6E9Q5_9AGAR|nr:Sec1-like snare protein [Crepidotus variabilis]
MASLITIIRNKFLEAIRSVNPPARWKILVVDDFSQKLLGAVLKQFDILEENVTLIESISSNRELQPEFEAIYMLMPTSNNVNRVIKDFTNQKQYAAAHLFFIEGLPEHLFQQLTASAAEPYLQALKELFLNIHAIEAQAFSLEEPSYFFSMYAPPRTEAGYKPARARLEEDLRFASKKIANICITLGEFPYIRYYFPSHHLPLGPLKPVAQNRPPPPPETASRWRTNLARGDEARQFEAVESDFVTKLLAFMVQSELEDYKKKLNPDFGKPDHTRPRATLIITDRSMDMFAPLVHEFTYQAMANDLLPIDNGTKYTYKFQSSLGAYEDKTATLSDADNVWTVVRHLHMREAIDKLMTDFNKFLEDNAVFKGEGAANLNDMKDMLASLPQYQDQREKFSLHLNMAQECMGIFEKDNLSDLATVEQSCATGLTAEGKTPKGLVEEMVPLLDSRDVINMRKVRIIALYIQYREGVPDEDKRRLYQHARLNLSEQDAVNALVHLGVRVTRGPNDKDVKRKIKQRPSAGEEYELSRFKPAIRAVLEDQIADKLDSQTFPYVRDAPMATPLSPKSPPPQTTSLRSQKPAWHRAPKPATVADNRQRVIMFVAGGMTYSEMREVYQISSPLQKDIFIGSTHIVTPKGFIDDLKVLELGGAGSKAVPNGLRDMRGEPKSFQDLYDTKYYVRDAPPAIRQPPPSQPIRQERPPAVQPSPTNSYHGSSTSVTPSVKDEKKKKRNLFGFR